MTYLQLYAQLHSIRGLFDPRTLDLNHIAHNPLCNMSTKNGTEIRPFPFKKMRCKTSAAKSRLCCQGINVLTHWGRVTHISVSKLIIIGSDNGLSPSRRQAIIWTNAGTLLIGPLGTNFNEILIEIHTFSFKKMHLKMSSAKWRLFRLGLNVFKNVLI